MSIEQGLFQENERLTPDASARRFAEIGAFQCEGGGSLERVQIAYQTWGQLNAERSNAILVCHALSGDSNAAGWWDRVVGPGRAIDTERFFVVGANALGGCQGSTGPSSEHPGEGRPYGSRFPRITVGDIAEAYRRALRAIGVETLLGAAGGSMGGMVALDLSRRMPVAGVWATASCAAHNALQIGFNEAARQAVRRDPKWRGGDYPLDDAPSYGLAVARMVGHLSYLSEASFERKFGRRRREDGLFEVESYLNYQGDKFTARFDANSLLVLSRAIDDFECDSLADTPVDTEYLFTSFASDTLYPSHQSAALRDLALASGRQAEWFEIDLPYGHDAFLLDGDLQGAPARRFFERLSAR